MHLKNPLLFGLMTILLLCGTITPGLAQSSPEIAIILINEVEINPTQSSDTRPEFVELYNPTSQAIDVSGWLLSPSATWKALKIPSGTIVEPKSFLTQSHVNFWFNNFGDTVSLYDTSGKLIDETPVLIDTAGDGHSWQRITDGLDTNSVSDWILKTMNPNSSNGEVIDIEESVFTLTIQTDKNNYVFGESLIISGTVSERLSNEILRINIQGPEYYKNLALFPDMNLEFLTSLSAQKVYGFKQGTYEITTTYGDEIVKTNFELSDVIDESSKSDSVDELRIFTDSESYIVGEHVLLSAETNSSISTGGLEYTVTNPNGKIVFEGTIFQNSEFSIVNQHAGGQLFPFTAKLYMSPASPIFGTYEIEATYKSQTYPFSDITLSAKTSFDLVEDVKDDVSISLSTDKELYNINDIIHVTGRSNDVWVDTLNIEVLQTGVLTRDLEDVKGQYVRPNPFSLIDKVRLNGDGTFEFEFQVTDAISELENNPRYGDYKIRVFASFGDAYTSIKLVEDPESFVEFRTPLGLKSDKSEYVLGQGVTISGKILDMVTKQPGTIQLPITLTFTDPTGNLMEIQDRRAQSDFEHEARSPNTIMKYKATPDPVGAFSADVILTPIVFDYGIYTVTAHHPTSSLTESIQFKIKSAQSEILETTETQEPITLELCQSNETSITKLLKDLKKIKEGELTPSMDSLVCSDNHNFKTGEKMIVTGKVIPKNPTSLDQSSTNPSGGTLTGSSYSTNYAQAQMNYVTVSIPYPTSMGIAGSSSVQTIPDEGEDYRGGGGSGGGGVSVGDGSGASTNEREDADRSRGYNASIIYKQQTLLLTDMNFKAYPDDEGYFVGVFDLRAGIFKQGTYAVKANYYGYNADTYATITDTSLKGGSQPEIELNLDKSEYVPGEIVKISGKIKNIFYYDSVSLKVETHDISKINCLSGQDCGHGNTAKKVRTVDDVDGANFFMNYKIPFSQSSIGQHIVTADTHFGQVETSFFVISESDVIQQSPPSSTILKKVIEKFNRIPENEIPIILSEKSSEDLTLVPRVLQGSLFTSARGEEPDVNLRITTSDGQCVIGQTSDCLVSESTRKPGEIYSIVSINDVNYKIRYSGNDVRLEKFSIVPEEPGSKIDINNWNVEIIKDEQPSRFYYKVSYVALE